MRTIAVVALLCLMAASTRAGFLKAKAKDDACKCVIDPTLLPFQLVRGEDQVRQCEQGRYCNCATGKVKRCVSLWLVTWKYNEQGQVCDAGFDCQKYFDSLTTTPAPTTTTTTTPAPTTTTPAPTTTTPVPTTTTTTPAPTTTTTTTPAPTTTTPAPTTTTPAPTTTTPAPTTTPNPDIDPYCLACSGEPRKQLIRGLGEVDKCEERLYCDCETKEQKKCVLPFTKLDPDHQSCRLVFNCAEWLRDHPVTTPAPTTTTPKPTTTTPKPTTTTPRPTTTPKPTTTTPKPTTTTPKPTTTPRPTTTTPKPTTTTPKPTTTTPNPTTTTPSPEPFPWPWPSSASLSARATGAVVLISVALALLL